MWTEGDPTFFYTNRSGLLHVTPKPTIIRVESLFFRQNRRPRVGTLTGTNGSIVQVPHLTCLQDKTQQQVEDFYNSHCGGRESRKISRLVWMRTHKKLQPKECFRIFSSTLSEERRRAALIQRAERAEKKTTTQDEPKHNRDNSFFHASPSSRFSPTVHLSHLSAGQQRPDGDRRKTSVKQSVSPKKI